MMNRPSLPGVMVLRDCIPVSRAWMLIPVSVKD